MSIEYRITYIDLKIPKKNIGPLFSALKAANQCDESTESIEAFLEKEFFEFTVSQGAIIVTWFDVEGITGPNDTLRAILECFAPYVAPESIVRLSSEYGTPSTIVYALGKLFAFGEFPLGFGVDISQLR